MTKEAVAVLVLLVPGILFVKVVGLRCPQKELKYQYFLTDSLLASLVVYLVASFFGVNYTEFTLPSVAWVLLISFVLGVIWSIVVNQDWLPKVLRSKGSFISTHDFIFPVTGMNEFRNKWHVVGLESGKEVCGVIRRYDVETNEALLENARWVLGSGELASDPSWVYLPPGNSIIYMRTLEE